MIKEVESHYIGACVDVIRRSFQTVADEFGLNEENAPRFTAFATTIERLSWQRDHECRPMAAYFEGDIIVGYYSLSLSETPVCELNNLCVLPAYRHRKIGEQLLNHAFAEAQSHHCIKMKIGIVEENERLKKWYQTFGFVPTGTKKFDFFPFTCGYMEKMLDLEPTSSNKILL